MKKVLVEICVGTACYVMGASELMLIEDYLTPEQKERVEIKVFASTPSNLFRAFISRLQATAAPPLRSDVFTKSTFITSVISV